MTYRAYMLVLLQCSLIFKFSLIREELQVKGSVKILIK